MKDAANSERVLSEPLGTRSREQPKSPEAMAFEDGLADRLAKTRVDTPIHEWVLQAFLGSLTKGLDGLPPADARETLGRRLELLNDWCQGQRARMLPELVQAELDGNNELLRSWGENIRKNAKLQKKVAFLNMLKAQRLNAEAKARACVSGHTSPETVNAGTHDRPVEAPATPKTLAPFGPNNMNSAFCGSNTTGVCLRKPPNPDRSKFGGGQT